MNARKTIASDVHCLACDLHPTKLEVVGLAPAVEGLCRDVSRYESSSDPE